MAVSGTGRKRPQERRRPGVGIAQAASAPHGLPLDGAARHGNARPRRHNTRDGRAIDWWFSLSSTTRGGYLGAALTLITALSYAGLLVRGQSTAVLASAGRLAYALAGWGAYPVLLLLLAGGVTKMAEGVARRRLLRPRALVWPLLLWLLLEAASQFAVGAATGGWVGRVSAQPLRALPPLLAWVLMILAGLALCGAISGVHPTTAARLARRTTHHVSDRIARRLATLRATRADTAADVGEPRADDGTARPLPGVSDAPAVDAPAQGGSMAGARVRGGFPLVAGARARWELPPLDLFDMATAIHATDDALIVSLVQRMEVALRHLRVDATVRREEIVVGPGAVRIYLYPHDRVQSDRQSNLIAGASGRPAQARARISQLLGLRQELAQALHEPQLRLLAPAQGEARLAVEMPRHPPVAVGLYELLLSEELARVGVDAGLMLPLGRGVDGRVCAIDLARTPHVLFAGAAGSGKSTALRALLAGLLARATPEDARLLLVDTTQRALLAFEGVPHLLMPVVSESAVAIAALSRTLEEVQSRQQVLRGLGLPSVRAYRHLARQEPELEPLPAILVIIDGWEHWEQRVRREVWRLLARIAQHGRMADIHLIVATTPAVVAADEAEPLPALYARVALAVASTAESHAVVGVAGAEHLAHPGDLLYVAADGEPAERAQGASVSPDEECRLTRFWRRQAQAQAQDDPPTVPTHDTGGAERAGEGAPQREDLLLPPLPRRAGMDPPERTAAAADLPARGLAEWLARPLDATPGEGTPGAADWTAEAFADMMQQMQGAATDDAFMTP